MALHDWDKKVAIGRCTALGSHTDTIKKLIGESCVHVREIDGDDPLNAKGIDFIATLRHGAELNIDTKGREAGCSKFWKFYGEPPDLFEPELALEKWSVVPENGRPGKTGWTLDESKLTDYTLHVFDPMDSRQVFLLPFQLLRMAFQRHITAWWARYDHKSQETIRGSRNWRSECVFVPAYIVLGAIMSEMRPGIQRG